MRFHIEVTFLSDWHVGEGAGGAGHIDRLVRRDPVDSLPYLPAKTLTGILRDGCEKVAFGLDDGQPAGPWQRFTAALFGFQAVDSAIGGETSSAPLSIRPAYLDAQVRTALANNPDLRRALTFVKPGVKLNDGVAQSRMLRLEEMVLSGAVLGADAELALAGSAAGDTALALLWAGARAVERLGGKRRRGAGRCVISLKKPGDQGPLLDANRVATLLAEKEPLAIPRDDPAELSFSWPVTATSAAARPWYRIPLCLELLTPVLVPDAVSGNVVATRDFIPGSLLVPALNRRLRQLMGSEGANLPSHLAAGRVQVRNAYPLHENCRLLPVPLALEAEKENPGKVRCGLHAKADDGVQRKQLRDGYAAPGFLPATGSNSDSNPITRVVTQATTHAVIEDSLQRASAKVGGVYTYESIAPAQRFAAEILVDGALLGQDPDCTGLTGEVRIGRAKKDDYGRVGIIAGGAIPVNDDADEMPVHHFTLWLAAPLLARDSRLRPVLDAATFVSWLERQLGGNARLSLNGVAVRTFRDDGWNSAWREPRATRFGMASGSCFSFACEEVRRSDLRRLQREGLGERRGEGYGEIVIDAPLLGQAEIYRVATKNTDTLNPGNTAPGIPLKDFVRQLHTRAWRLALRRAALAKGPELVAAMGWLKGKPSNAQLGALRDIFERWRDSERLRQWLAHLRDMEQRREAWRGGLTVLQAFAANPGEVWNYLDRNQLPVMAGIAAQDRDSLIDEMSIEATRILWLTAIGQELDRRAAVDNKEGN